MLQARIYASALLEHVSDCQDTFMHWGPAISKDSLCQLNCFQYVWLVACRSMTMYLGVGQELGGFELISLYNTKVFWQYSIITTWVVVFYIIHPLNLVISTLIELDSHHGL